MIVLGVNAYHGDTSACVLVNGEVVAAVEEERFTREKHQAGFPSEAVRWCLGQAGASARDIDHVGISRDPLAHIGRKVLRTLRDRRSIRSVRQRLSNNRQILSARDGLAATLDVDPKDLRAKFHRVEHHRSHMASAFLCSPFEDATTATLDGMGDYVSAMWGVGQGSSIGVRGNVGFPDSLGVFYTAFTQFLGLPSYGDEYKLMGLAAYGGPSYLDELRDVVGLDGMRICLDLDYFVHHDRGVDMTWTGGTPLIGQLWSDHVAERFGPARVPRSEVTDRDRDLAASVQARLEEIELEWLRNLHARCPSPRLVLAGGVALNCVVNGRIVAETPFEDLWVQPAANDAGTALGAALWIWNATLGWPRSWEMRHAYLGPSYDEAACGKALRAAGLTPKRFDDDELLDYTARRLAEGAIVGWYQGHTEFGPRALGNRSIVCDPRRRNTKDVLNARIKHREPFRPFAPSVLEEATGDWFAESHPSPYMLLAYDVRPECRERIPAVTHADGTARLQTVSATENPRYHGLIDAVGRQTGVPVILNTSFNENEPIVNRPEEAVACFTRTQMDVLVLGNLVIDRNTSGLATE
ncbi:MAG: carbamoyltransferase family protein [Acidimicrobiia bacterium]